MSCPKQEQVAAWVEGDVTPDTREHLTGHVRSCLPCHRLSRRIAASVGTLQRLALPEASEAFTSAVTQRIRQSRRAPRARLSANWGMGMMLAAAACALLAVPVVALRQDSLQGEFTARGSAAAGNEEQRRVGFEAYLHRNVPTGVATLVKEGETLESGDGLSFILYNRSGRPLHFMIFGVDARKELHWFYPAYSEPGTNPPAPLLQANETVAALPEGVTPESPAQGSFEVVSLFTEKAVHVEEVETLISKSGLESLSRSIPGVVVHRMRVQMKSLAH